MSAATTSYSDSAISVRAVLEPLGATPVGLCGGDGWEPEIAANHLGHVYVVFAHFPGDPSCGAESGAPREIFVRTSSDGGRTFVPIARPSPFQHWAPSRQ